MEEKKKREKGKKKGKWPGTYTQGQSESCSNLLTLILTCQDPTAKNSRELPTGELGIQDGWCRYHGLRRFEGFQSSL